MDDLSWESPHSSDGIAPLVGRGRALLAATTALLALIAYLGGPRSSTGPHVGRVPDRQSPVMAAAGGSNVPSSSSPRVRVAIHAAQWDDIVAEFPAMVQGTTLTRVRDVADRLSAAAAQLFTYSRIPFRVDIVESAVVDEYAFTDGRLLLTSGFVSRLETPGQVAAVLSQMMERVLVARDPQQASSPWARLSVAMMAKAGFDPRAIAWIIDRQVRSISPQTPDAAARLASLQQQTARVSTEISAAFPQGVPQTLIK